MATKKSFKDNPALQFLSTPQEEETAQPEALQKTAKAPAGYKLNPLYIETKSKRLQLVLQPSLLARVKERAKEQGLSVNEFVHRILEEATREE